MPRKRREIQEGLAAKGFELEENDHTYFTYLTIDGRRTRARTKMSHGSLNKDVPDYVLTQMARQVRLPLGQFRNLVDCPLDRAAYEAILAKTDAIPEQ